MIDYIKFKENILAIVIRNSYTSEGVNFFTPDNFSQQLAYMHHPAGKGIQPHIHNHVSRTVVFTQEVLLIKKGKVRVDFYTQEKDFLQSTTILEGDVILLASGGHGFEILEETEMIEIKQGPYLGENDKVRF